MERTTIRADRAVAYNLMNSLYALYMAIVKGMGGDPDDPNICGECQDYARKKFVALADEFEDVLPMRWTWVFNEDEDEEDDD